MATEKLKIDVTTNAKKAGKEINGLSGQVVGLANSIGVAAVAYKAFQLAVGESRAIIQTAATYETLQARLESLYGSAERGAKAFATFKDVAASTPFQVTEVVDAGAKLKAFGQDAEELIKVTADLAAFMSVDMATAASQFGRSMSAGLASADIFREKGISQMIKDFHGLTDVTQISGEMIVEALESITAGATDRLSKTFTGAVSNMQDSISEWRNSIGSDLLPIMSKLAKATGEFFRKATETSLETTIRQMKEFGIAGERIARLEYLKMKKDLMDITMELNKHKAKYGDIEKEIAKASKAMEKVDEIFKDIERTQEIDISNKENVLDLLNKQTGSYDKAKKLYRGMLVNGYEEEEIRDEILRRYDVQLNEQQKQIDLSNKLNITQQQQTLLQDQITGFYIDQSAELDGLNEKATKLSKIKIRPEIDFGGMEFLGEEDEGFVISAEANFESFERTVAEGLSRGREAWSQYYADLETLYITDDEYKRQLESEYGEFLLEQTLKRNELANISYQALEAGYDALVSPILDSSLTAEQRMTKMWDATKKAAVGAIGEILKEGIKSVIKQELIANAASIASISTAITTGASIAAAYTGAATLASLATLGGNSVGAIAGMNATMGVAQAMAIPKFEQGGILGGSSYMGDSLIFRGNSGEEVLTASDPRHINNGGKNQINITPLINEMRMVKNAVMSMNVNLVNKNMSPTINVSQEAQGGAESAALNRYNTDIDLAERGYIEGGIS